MRAHWKLGLVTVLVVCVEGAARAQDEVRAFVGAVALLRDRDVQEELQLTRPQKLRLSEDLGRVRDRHKDEIARVREMKPEERESFRKTIRAELREAAAQILSQEQIKRLEQIHLQTSGPDVFLDDKVQNPLQLGPEQKRKVEEMVKDSKQREKEIAEGEADRHQKNNQKQKLQRQTVHAILALLNEAQRQSWKEMTGEPFE